MPSRIGRTSLSEQVAAAIIEAVVAGKYVPGGLLPSEPELARLFGVSRPVIREAVRILATKGVVRSEHGRGVVVLAYSSLPLFDYLTLSAWRLRVPAYALWETRRMMDLALAEMAATRCNETDLARLRDALERMARRLREEGTHDSQADAEFHRALAAAAHNELVSVLVDSLTQLNGAVTSSFIERARRSGDLASPAMVRWPERSYVVHENIYNALTAQDVARTQDAVRAHWDQSFAMWGSQLETTMDELVGIWPPSLVEPATAGAVPTPAMANGERQASP